MAKKHLYLENGHVRAEDSTDGLSWLAIDHTFIGSLTVDEGALIDSTSGAVAFALPVTPAIGDVVGFNHVFGDSATNNTTISGNSSLINSSSTDLIIDVSGVSGNLVFVGGTIGWKVILSAVNGVGAIPGGGGGDSLLTLNLAVDITAGSPVSINSLNKIDSIVKTGSPAIVTPQQGTPVYDNSGGTPSTSKGIDHSIGIMEPHGTVIFLPFENTTNNPTGSELAYSVVTTDDSHAFDLQTNMTFTNITDFTYWILKKDTDSGRYLLITTGSTGLVGRVATLSGTIFTFGPPLLITENCDTRPQFAYDPINSCFSVVFNDSLDPNRAVSTIKVVTDAGLNLTVSNVVYIAASGAGYYDIIYNPVNEKMTLGAYFSDTSGVYALSIDNSAADPTVSAKSFFMSGLAYALRMVFMPDIQRIAFLYESGSDNYKIFQVLTVGDVYSIPGVVFTMTHDTDPEVSMVLTAPGTIVVGYIDDWTNVRYMEFVVDGDNFIENIILTELQTYGVDFCRSVVLLPFVDNALYGLLYLDSGSVTFQIATIDFSAIQAEKRYGILQETGLVDELKIVAGPGSLSSVHAGLTPGARQYVNQYTGDVTEDPTPFFLGISISDTEILVADTLFKGKPLIEDDISVTVQPYNIGTLVEGEPNALHPRRLCVCNRSVSGGNVMFSSSPDAARSVIHDRQFNSQPELAMTSYFDPYTAKAVNDIHELTGGSAFSHLQSEVFSNGTYIYCCGGGSEFYKFQENSGMLHKIGDTLSVIYSFNLYYNIAYYFDATTEKVMMVYGGDAGAVHYRFIDFSSDTPITSAESTLTITTPRSELVFGDSRPGSSQAIVVVMKTGTTDMYGIALNIDYALETVSEGPPTFLTAGVEYFERGCCEVIFNAASNRFICAFYKGLSTQPTFRSVGVGDTPISIDVGPEVHGTISSATSNTFTPFRKLMWVASGRVLFWTTSRVGSIVDTVGVLTLAETEFHISAPIPMTNPIMGNYRARSCVQPISVDGLTLMITGNSSDDHGAAIVRIELTGTAFFPVYGGASAPFYNCLENYFNHNGFGGFAATVMANGTPIFMSNRDDLNGDAMLQSIRTILVNDIKDRFIGVYPPGLPNVPAGTPFYVTTFGHVELTSGTYFQGDYWIDENGSLDRTPAARAGKMRYAIGSGDGMYVLGRPEYIPASSFGPTQGRPTVVASGYEYRDTTLRPGYGQRIVWTNEGWMTEHGYETEPKPYLDNADALANMLKVGDFYRTGDILKVVHS